MSEFQTTSAHVEAFLASERKRQKSRVRSFIYGLEQQGRHDLESIGKLCLKSVTLVSRLRTEGSNLATAVLVAVGAISASVGAGLIASTNGSSNPLALAATGIVAALFGVGLIGTAVELHNR